MIAIIPEPLIGMPGTLIGIVRNPQAKLEQELLAAAKGPKIEVSISEIRKKGLITALRERARRA